MASRHSPAAFRQLPLSSPVPSGAGNRSGSIGPVQRPCGPKVAWTSGQFESSHWGLNHCSLRPAWPDASTMCRNTHRSTPMEVVVAGSAKSPHRLSSVGSMFTSHTSGKATPLPMGADKSALGAVNRSLRCRPRPVSCSPGHTSRTPGLSSNGT